MKPWQAKPVRPCQDCQAPCWGVRCRRCYQRHTAARPRPGLTNSWKERQRRARAVREWIQVYGDWCPGWGVPAHAAARLSADHVIPVAAGGPEDGELAILCVSCNSRKRDKITPPKVGGVARWPFSGSRPW